MTIDPLLQELVQNSLAAAISRKKRRIECTASPRTSSQIPWTEELEAFRNGASDATQLFTDRHFAPLKTSLETLGLEAFEEVVGLAFDWLTEKAKREKVGTLASLSQTGGSYEDRAAPETPYSPGRPSISDFSSTSAYVTPSPARQERSLKRE